MVKVPYTNKASEVSFGIVMIPLKRMSALGQEFGSEKIFSHYFNKVYTNHVH